MTATGQTQFERATAVVALGDGAWRAEISHDWSAPIGPNGGYVAAIVLRAMQAAVDDPARAPRSLTCHYLRPPAEGEAVVRVTVERSGRTMTSVSARLEQEGKVCVLALGALGLDKAAPLDYQDPPPALPEPESIEPMMRHPLAPPIAHRLDIRWTSEVMPLSGADESVVSGWMRLADPGPVDAAVVALLTDALLPAPWPRLTELAPAPTIDLTIHFRNRVDALDLDWVHGRFTSAASTEGFFEEDGVLHAPDGTLLAQSRQLALLMGGTK